MNYQEEIKKHLEKYKNEHFKSIENGIWRKNKVSYPYILPIGEEKLNLLRSCIHSVVIKNTVKFDSKYNTYLMITCYFS